MSSVNLLGSCPSSITPALRKVARLVLRKLYFKYRRKQLVATMAKSVGIGVESDPNQLINKVIGKLSDDQVRWIVSTYGFISPRSKVFIYQAREGIPNPPQLLSIINNSPLRDYLWEIRRVDRLVDRVFGYKTIYYDPCYESLKIRVVTKGKPKRMYVDGILRSLAQPIAITISLWPKHNLVDVRVTRGELEHANSILQAVLMQLGLTINPALMTFRGNEIALVRSREFSEALARISVKYGSNSRLAKKTIATKRQRRKVYDLRKEDEFNELMNLLEKGRISISELGGFKAMGNEEVYYKINFNSNHLIIYQAVGEYAYLNIINTLYNIIKKGVRVESRGIMQWAKKINE